MTVYNGEFTEVIVTATIARTADTTQPLTDEDVDAAVIDIWDAANELITAAQPLTYDADRGVWFYPWNTNGLDAGSYQSRATFTGPGTFKSWEYGRLRVAQDREPESTP